MNSHFKREIAKTATLRPFPNFIKKLRDHPCLMRPWAPAPWTHPFRNSFSRKSGSFSLPESSKEPWTEIVHWLQMSNAEHSSNLIEGPSQLVAEFDPHAVSVTPSIKSCFYISEKVFNYSVINTI